MSGIQIYAISNSPADYNYSWSFNFGWGGQEVNSENYPTNVSTIGYKNSGIMFKDRTILNRIYSGQDEFNNDRYTNSEWTKLRIYVKYNDKILLNNSIIGGNINNNYFNNINLSLADISNLTISSTTKSSNIVPRNSNIDEKTTVKLKSGYKIRNGHIIGSGVNEYNGITYTIDTNGYDLIMRGKTNDLIFEMNNCIDNKNIEYFIENMKIEITDNFNLENIDEIIITSNSVLEII